MTAAQPVLAVSELVKSFGPTRALAGVDLAVQPATVHALLGGNGSGKSSLVKVLAGVYQADSGRITLNGRQFAARDYRAGDGHAGGLRFVHQDLGLIHDSTVAENIAFTTGFAQARFGRISWRSLHRRTAALLEQFEIDVSPTTPVGRLRPADRTMVAIARALADSNRPQTSTPAPAGTAPEPAADHRLLVLDEPTASLPQHESEVLLTAIRRRAAQGQSIILVSHHLQEVLDIADTITVLRDGKVAGTVRAADADAEQIVSLIAGRAVELAASASGSAPVAARPVLSVRALAAGPLAGVDVAVRAGEIVGVVGLLGSGRSSLVRAVFGDLPRRGGTVEIDGVPLAPAAGPAAAMAAGVALVPEDRNADAAFPDQSVQDNLSAAVHSLYWRGGLRLRRRESADSRQLIEEFGIRTQGPAALLSSLSGGNQQKAILARWLRREPKVLLLDEPTQGVDIVSRADIYRLVRAAAARGCAVLIASSDAEEISLLCDRAIVLGDGRVIAELGSGSLDPDTLLRASHSARADLQGTAP